MLPVRLTVRGQSAALDRDEMGERRFRLFEIAAKPPDCVSVHRDDLQPHRVGQRTRDGPHGFGAGRVRNRGHLDASFGQSCSKLTETVESVGLG